MNQRQQLIEQIRQQSIHARAMALREAAQKQANSTPIAAAAAGASGGGRRIGCTERDGLTMTWKSPESEEGFTIIQRVFLPYTGQDKSGNATFGLVTDRFTSGSGQNGEFIIRVSKSGDQWLLEFAQASTERTEVAVAAQSSDLYEGWIGLVFEPFDTPLEDITATCGDQTYRKLCITNQFDSPFGAFIRITGGVEYIIPEISEEYPAAYGGIDKPDLFWDFESGAWVVGRDRVENADDISQPPIGQFGRASEQITITEGSCTGNVPTPPEPTLVTTSDIQVNGTSWNWSSFSGSFSVSGSIGPFIIDGQSGGVSSPPFLSQALDVVPTSFGPTNDYRVSIIPIAEGRVQVSIGLSTYTVISMLLNITVAEGSNPLTQGTGSITAISGTITYEIGGSNSGPAPAPR
jgi:hypothetical protein